MVPLATSNWNAFLSLVAVVYTSDNFHQTFKVLLNIVKIAVDQAKATFRDVAMNNN